MPKLVDLYKMKRKVIAFWLCILPTSQYKGLPCRQVAKIITKNSARKYLTTLILLNDRNKSQLLMISEESGEVSASSGSRRSSSQIL